MTDAELIVHACEQVLRFSTVETWDSLNEERKVQLGFNAGIMALGLSISKEEGYMVLVQAREGKLTMPQLHQHFRNLALRHNVKILEENIHRPF